MAFEDAADQEILPAFDHAERLFPKAIMTVATALEPDGQIAESGEPAEMFK